MHQRSSDFWILAECSKILSIANQSLVTPSTVQYLPRVHLIDSDFVIIKRCSSVYYRLNEVKY